MGNNILDAIMDLKKENEQFRHNLDTYENNAKYHKDRIEKLLLQIEQYKKQYKELLEASKLSWKNHLLKGIKLAEFEMKNNSMNNYTETDRNCVTGCDQPDEWQINTGRM